MKTWLTEAECETLCAETGVQFTPYGAKSIDYPFFGQVATPRDSRSLLWFLRGLLVDPQAKQAIVHFTDWSAYRPEEMEIIHNVHKAASDTRLLIETPALLLTDEHVALASELFLSSILYGWSAYLYLPERRFTLYNWEGDLIDYWAMDRADEEALKSLGE